MTGDVRCRHRLANSASSQASCVILPYFAGRSVGCKRSLSDHGHSEHTRIYPCLKRLEGVSGAETFWIHSLEIWDDALDAINRPASRYLMISIRHKLHNGFVHACSRRPRLPHAWMVSPL